MLFEIQGEYTQKSESKVVQAHDDVFENMTDEEIIEDIEHNLSIFKANKKRRAEYIEANNVKED